MWLVIYYYMSQLTLEGFRNFFKFYNSEEHQMRAIEELYYDLPDELKDETSEWVVTYRSPKEDVEPEPEVKDGYVTAELMQRLTGYPAKEFDSVFVNDCNRLFRETGFDKHLDAMQMLMANMMHETCNFIYMQEIADGRAYEYRTDLGNTQPGDGPKYKGAGVLQLTGKYNYSRLSKGIADPKVMDGVDYVSNTYPFTSARIWIEENDLLSICLNQGFDQCCRKINGGFNGYNDRLAKYRICQREMR